MPAVLQRLQDPFVPCRQKALAALAATLPDYDPIETAVKLMPGARRPRAPGPHCRAARPPAQRTPRRRLTARYCVGVVFIAVCFISSLDVMQTCKGILSKDYSRRVGG